MKVIIATLLFISAAEAIRNLVGLPEERFSRLHQLLNGNFHFVYFRDQNSLYLTVTGSKDPAVCNVLYEVT